MPDRQAFISTDKMPLMPLHKQAKVSDWNNLCFVSGIAEKMYVFSPVSFRQVGLAETNSRYAFVTSPYTGTSMLLSYLSEDRADAFRVDETFTAANRSSMSLTADIRLFAVHRIIRMNGHVLADPHCRKKWDCRQGAEKPLSRVDGHYCMEQCYKFHRDSEMSYAVVDKIVVAENFACRYIHDEDNGKGRQVEFFSSPLIVGYICKMI